MYRAAEWLHQLRTLFRMYAAMTPDPQPASGFTAGVWALIEERRRSQWASEWGRRLLVTAGVAGALCTGVLLTTQDHYADESQVRPDAVVAGDISAEMEISQR